MKARYAIRPAVRADLDRVMEIETASFGGEAYDRKLFAYYLRRCEKLFLVLRRGSKIFAYSITCIRGGAGSTKAELVSIAVDPARRQAGAASALLDSMLRRLRRRGVSRLNLVVRVTNHQAEALYAKYGFRRVRVVRGYYEDGGDGVAMSRAV